MCLVDGLKEDITVKVSRGECPLGLYANATVDPDPTPFVRHAPPSMEVLGPALWREIHTATEPTPEFIANIQQRLPCGPCKSSMAEYLRDNPPDYENWFDWAWRLHNAVNAKLGHPEVGLDEAKKIWK